MSLKKSKRTALVATLLVLLMLMNGGYAVLSTNLAVNGNATNQKQSWLIYFDNIQTTEGSVEPTTISNTKETELTWEVILDTPGQFYEFTVDTVNGGMTNAMIGDLSNSNPLTEEQEKYLNYSVTYSDGSAIEQYDKLDAGARETIKIRLEFDKNINAEDLPTEEQEIIFVYISNYVQADSNAKERKRVTPLQMEIQ